MINYILAIIQIIVSILLVVGILLQQRGSALGSTFGQEGGAFYGTRRGIQKKIFWGTAVMGVLFVLTAFLSIIF
jgi:protein translocase SecG subunit